MEKEISQAVIRRMPRYYRYLGELLEEGVERISSNDLSNRMHGDCIADTSGSRYVRRIRSSKDMAIMCSFYMMGLEKSLD